MLGTPVDCVKLAMHTIVPRRPDLLLSGINHGSNAGNSVIYSGTMGAVFEGCMSGIPSVGYSLLHHSWKADFTECLPLVKEITAKVLEDGLPEGLKNYLRYFWNHALDFYLFCPQCDCQGAHGAEAYGCTCPRGFRSGGGRAELRRPCRVDRAEDLLHRRRRGEDAPEDHLAGEHLFISFLTDSLNSVK